MLLAWIAMGAMGGQGALTVEEFDQIVRDQIASIEAVAGRPSMGLLRTDIYTRARLVGALRKPPPSFGTDRPIIERLPPEVLAEREEEFEQSLAVYVPDLQGIYLIKESMEELFTDAQIHPDQARPIVRCIVAHEVVHALQHQYGGFSLGEDLSEDQRRGMSAVEEGHATYIGSRWCLEHEGPQIAALAEMSQGLGLGSVLDPAEETATYAYGRLLADAFAREDPALVWSAIAAQPPSWDLIVRDARRALGAGWEDPVPLRGALSGLGVSEALLEPASLAALSRILGISPSAAPPISAGLSYLEARQPASLVVYRLAQGGEAEKLLAYRAKQLNQTDKFGVYLSPIAPQHIASIDWSAGRKLPELPGVKRSLEVKIRGTDGARYVERWLATEDHLVWLATVGKPAQKPETLLTAILEWLPTTAPEQPDLSLFPSLTPWISAVRSRAADTIAVTAPEWRMQNAAWLFERNLPDPCGRTFGDVLDGSTAIEDPGPWHRAAYQCALLVEDWALADRVAGKLSIFEPAWAASHVWSLSERGQTKEALALVDRALRSLPPDVSAEERLLLVDARIGALAQARRFSELASLALAEGSPETRVAAAQDLLSVGRAADAKKILAAACPRVEPKPEVCLGF